MNSKSSLTVIKHIEALGKCVDGADHSQDSQLRAHAADIRAALEEAKSSPDEPTQTVVALNRLKNALAKFRKTAQQSGGSKTELVALAHEAEASVIREVSARSQAIWAYVTKRLRSDSRHYIRETADAENFGPVLINDGLVRLHIKTRQPTTGPGTGIDDLAATCGIWICNPFGETCLCSEWECSGDGPSGSFP